MGTKRIKGKEATVTITDAYDETRGPYQVRDLYPSARFESTDAQFADKLDKEFMMEDYREEAERRGITLEELFKVILQRSSRTYRLKGLATQWQMNTH